MFILLVGHSRNFRAKGSMQLCMFEDPFQPLPHLLVLCNPAGDNGRADSKQHRWGMLQTGTSRPTTFAADQYAQPAALNIFSSVYVFHSLRSVGPVRVGISREANRDTMLPWL